jgi:hypothetical protein
MLQLLLGLLIWLMVLLGWVLLSVLIFGHTGLPSLSAFQGSAHECAIGW